MWTMRPLKTFNLCGLSEQCIGDHLCGDCRPTRSTPYHLGNACSVDERASHAVLSTPESLGISAADAERDGTGRIWNASFRASKFCWIHRCGRFLDGAPPEPLRRVLPQTFEQMRPVGWTTRFVTEVAGHKYYPTVLDGSEYFHLTQIHCPSCLHQRQANGENALFPCGGSRSGSAGRES